MKRVVGVSLGSSRRDYRVEVRTPAGDFVVERIGTDGDLRAARSLVRQLDGRVSAMGLGGVNVYLYAGTRRFVLRDGLSLARAARVTPVVDGTCFKRWVEPSVVGMLARDWGCDFAGKTALVVSALDRFELARELGRAGARVVAGDAVFALGLPLPLSPLWVFEAVAALGAPLLAKLPIGRLYPLGAGQERTAPRHGWLFRSAAVIAGDFHFIRRNMPPNLSGKVVVTSTLTPEDLGLLRARGVWLVATGTPAFSGRSVGANVAEAMVVAAVGKRPEDMRPEQYIAAAAALDFRPRVEELNRI